MITDYFKSKNVQPLITEYYELHRSFIGRNKFNLIFNETKEYLEINSSRKSCVCIDDNIDFNLYNLPCVKWTKTINEIRNKILENYNLYNIDYGLVHYYHDNNANITWHSDREALRSNIYSVNIGGVRRFCLRDKKTHEVLTFDLFDGDLFIMKVGCQDKYEHCIKSIKEFNNPRINLTFRQLEEPILYYTYYPSEMKIYATKEKPLISNYKKITETREKIIIGFIDNHNVKFSNIIECQINVSLIKSNLQKAIRRKLTDVALQSTMEMITSGNALNLLRRLTIISIEDVYINKYYDIIVWYYVALSKNYELTEFDVDFIYSYVKLLCSIDNYTVLNIDNIYNHELIYTDIYCVALYIRLQFGGFNGEKYLINKFIYAILNNIISIDQKDIVLTKYNLYEKTCILSCSIDYHCFPNMIGKIFKKIKTDKPNINLSENDIRNYIWVFDSNVNSRIEINTSLDINVWNNIIKPYCNVYRKNIMKLLNIERLY